MGKEGKNTIKDLPLDDRPREKLLLRGAHNLSDAELIAILLRTGKRGKSVLEIARDLLKREGTLAALATKFLRGKRLFGARSKRELMGRLNREISRCKEETHQMKGLLSKTGAEWEQQ